MKIAIIKVINGNFFIDSEGYTSVTAAMPAYHGLCQALWNASDVNTAMVMIVDEQLDCVGDHREFIHHEQA